MGQRVAHLVTGKMIDFIEFDDGFAIVKTRTPKEAVGRTLGESRLRTKYGVTVVGVKRPKQDFTYAREDTLVEAGDLLIVSGPTRLACNTEKRRDEVSPKVSNGEQLRRGGD